MTSGDFTPECDPREINNVCGQAEYASEIADMKAEYDRLRQQFDVPKERPSK